jgi:hypothetical protein
LEKILYDASSVDWFCKECDQRHSEDGKVSSERLSSDNHFVTTSQQPVTKRLEPDRVFGPQGQRKRSYLKKKYSSRMNYLRKKRIRKNSNMEGMVISRRQSRNASIVGSKEALYPRIEEGNSDREKSGEKSKCMKERKILAEALDRSLLAANGPQPFTPQNGTFDKAMSDLSNMGVMPKENNCLPSMHIENDSVQENQCGQSSTSVKISSEAIITLVASSREVAISDDVENFGKDKPRKRRRLILDDDDEVDEEKAEDVQKENVNPQPPKCDEPMTKHSVDTECIVEETVQTGELNDQNRINGPVKRRRRYIAENEDEEYIVGSDNVECALNDATNRSLNDDANMVRQTSGATDHSQQSRPSLSEYDDQEYYIYSQPLDEPVWRYFR